MRKLASRSDGIPKFPHHPEAVSIQVLAAVPQRPEYVAEPVDLAPRRLVEPPRIRIKVPGQRCNDDDKTLEPHTDVYKERHDIEKRDIAAPLFYKER